jgi:hypothetical protein
MLNYSSLIDFSDEKLLQKRFAVSRRLQDSVISRKILMKEDKENF